MDALTTRNIDLNVKDIDWDENYNRDDYFD